MLEPLIFAICINGPGCKEAARAYYEATPSLQEVVKNGEVECRRYLPIYFIQYVAPAVGAFSGLTATFKVYGRTTLSLKLNDRYISLQSEF